MTTRGQGSGQRGPKQRGPKPQGPGPHGKSRGESPPAHAKAGSDQSSSAAKGKPGTEAAAATGKPSGTRTLLENVECLAIAIVMALILKYFLIEAYKIPTGSMQPTIIGDERVGIFDRVLVNKMVYFLRAPRRYEVVVFRMPLVQRQNYIKRLVGLPGETVRIRNGDIFITPPDGTSQAIARKSDRVWRSVRKEILPGHGEPISLAEMFRERSGRPILNRDSIVLQASADAEASVELRNSVMDYYYDGYEPEWKTQNFKKRIYHVSDVEIAAEVTPSAGATAFGFEITESRFRHLAEFDCRSGTLVVSSFDHKTGELVLPPPSEVNGLDLEAGEDTEVSFRNVDDELVVLVDGNEVMRRPYVTTGVDMAKKDAKVALIARGGEVSIDTLRLYRDIYYTPSGGDSYQAEAIYPVPENHYFVLGDNTQNSHDCRQWELLTMELDDDRRIQGHYFKHQPPDRNPQEFRDHMVFTNIYGQRFEVPNDVERYPEPFRWVPEDFMLGKALAVFWPIPPFAPSWRLKWVR